MRSVLAAVVLVLVGVGVAPAQEHAAPPASLSATQQIAPAGPPEVQPSPVAAQPQTAPTVLLQPVPEEQPRVRATGAEAAQQQGTRIRIWQLLLVGALLGVLLVFALD